MRSNRVRLLAEIALTIALCAVLKLWRIQLPWNFAGGDISLVMLPILILALRRGVIPAAIAGAAFGVIDFFFEPYAVAPIQVLLDYPVAFALLSVAGFGSRQYRALSSSGRRVAAEAVAVPWMILGAGARFASHFVSGIIFFGSNAPEGTPVWAYSALYNLGYIVPSLIVTIVAALFVLPVLQAAIPVGTRSPGEVSL
jgi:thiamine transporter